MQNRSESSRKAVLDTTLFCIGIFFLYADQNLLAPNLSKVAEEFEFNALEKDQKLGGDIAMGFFLVGGVASLFFGYLSDTSNRCTLFSIVVALGEIASFSTSLSSNYWQLLTCRILTGISIGGATPILFSLVGDLFAENIRVYVCTIVGIACGAGATAGQLVAGLVGPVYGWRLPFLLISLPALFWVLLVFLITTEPTRGGIGEESGRDKEKQKEDSRNFIVDIKSPPFSPTSHKSDTNSVSSGSRQYSGEHVGMEISQVHTLLSTPSVLLVLLQGIPGCLPWGFIGVFLSDYFSLEGQLTVQAATGIMATFSLGTFLGQLLGGWLGQYLYNNFGPRWQCVLMGSSTLLGVFPLLGLLDCVQSSHSVRPVSNFKTGGGGVGSHLETSFNVHGMALLAGLLATITGPNVRAVLQNVCAPEIRGTAFALFTLTDDIGKGFGPAVVVVFIKLCHGDRKKAFKQIVLAWVICGIILLLLSATAEADERKAKARARSQRVSYHENQVEGSIMKHQTKEESKLSQVAEVSQSNLPDHTVVQTVKKIK